MKPRLLFKCMIGNNHSQVTSHGFQRQRRSLSSATGQQQVCLILQVAHSALEGMPHVAASVGKNQIRLLQRDLQFEAFYAIKQVAHALQMMIQLTNGQKLAAYMQVVRIQCQALTDPGFSSQWCEEP